MVVFVNTESDLVGSPWDIPITSTSHELPAGSPLSEMSETVNTTSVLSPGDNSTLYLSKEYVHGDRVSGSGGSDVVTFIVSSTFPVFLTVML